MVYSVNEVVKSFCVPIFKSSFEEKSRELAGKRSATELEEILAETVVVTQATVYNWRNQRGAPGDLRPVESIAEFLDLEQEDFFIVQVDEVNKLDARQREAVARVCRELEDYLFIINSPVYFIAR